MSVEGRMDFRQALGRVQCPVLLMASDRDPIMHMAFSEEVARCLPQHPVRFERSNGSLDAGTSCRPMIPNALSPCYGTL